MATPDEYGDKSIIDRARSEAYQKYLRDMMNRMKEDAAKSSAPRAKDNFDKSSDSAVVEVKLFEKENARNHHTDKYSLVHNKHNASLVIRRGQPFKIAIKFLGAYNPDMDDMLTLEFTFGHEPNRSKGSHVVLVVSNNKSFTRWNVHWDVRLESASGNQLQLEVQVPATVAVGVWNVSVNMTPKEPGVAVREHRVDKNIYILFNPWCKEDTVYLENDDFRDEYTLNDVGKLYYGTHAEYTSRRWVYGQFREASLPAAMFMLDLSGLLYNARSNPVSVSRAISNMMNKAETIPGDAGVLLGKWGKSNDDYVDGTAPWSWTGSALILEQFLKSNGKPVKYGQCWVFAGVATTVCRALGIPARNITCFVAGHDTDETLTIDVTYDIDGERTSNSADSIWNFHVWTETWMNRLDLPKGYDGWQVIDGTPQEISGGGYQLGPCSVFGVKMGQVGLQYDTLFVFSEVNSDMISWKQRDDDQGFDKAAVSTDHIGRLIITKRVGEYDDHGDDDVEDLTDTYKFREGTGEERATVLNAARNAGKSQMFDIPDPSKEELLFELVPVVNVMAGEDFQITLSIENRGEKRRTVMIMMRCYSVDYTGRTHERIWGEKVTVAVSPSQRMENETSWTVKASDYVDRLVELGMIKLYGMAMVPETNQSWAGEQDFVVKKPKLQLQIVKNSQGLLRVGKEYTLLVTFKNPLQTELTDCEFAAEGAGLIEAVHRRHRNISGREEVQDEFIVTPYYKCQTAIVVVFASRQLTGITGSKQITVVK